jgi:predicted hydrolase (HD superfamily)
MSSNVPTREEALELLKKYNKSESLIKHALWKGLCATWPANAAMTKKNGALSV